MKPFRSHNSAHNSSYGPSLTLMNTSEGPVAAVAPSPHADSIDHGVTDVPYQHGFSPYDFNGGTVAAVSGEDYCVIAADTRLSSGYEILSRNVTKLHAVTDRCVLASSGCKTDVDQLRAVLDIKMKVRYFWPCARYPPWFSFCVCLCLFRCCVCTYLCLACTLTYNSSMTFIHLFINPLLSTGLPA